MKHLLTFLIIFCSLPITAQQIVHGKVVSKTDGSIVEMATVRIFSYNGTDSTLVQGAQTDMDGEYWIGKVPEGKYKLYISSIGFKEQVLNITVTDQTLNVRTVQLEEDVQALNEVDVKGHAAEMTVKGDTIEYNTSAYKVGENAMVEELLKKMNGVTVDKEGNVTVNGEEIKGIRVDGKKFFGNDVQSATKNIPAEMIEKIQVIDEKSDMSKLTGFEDDETERIINLTLKANRKKGVFGNYNAGLGMDMVTENGKWFNYGDPAYGSTSGTRAKHFFNDDFRYSAGLFTNILLGESQTTIIGSANNTNEIRMGRGRGGFGGGANSGITWGENLGVNTNIVLDKNLNKKDSQTSLLFGGDASLSHSTNDTRTTSSKESYTDDATYFNNDSTNQISHMWNAQLRLELEYQIDTLNRLLFKPNLSYTDNESDSYNEYTNHRDSTTQSMGWQNQYSKSHTINASLNIIYSHKFMRPGRTLTINATAGLNDTQGYTKTLARDSLNHSNKVDQYTNSNNRSYNYSVKASYVEPIYHNNHLLELALSFNGNDRNSGKDQMSYDSINGTGYIFDSIYSNKMSNQFFSEAMEVNYRWLEEDFDLTVGMKLNPSQTHSMSYYGGVLTRDTTINVWNWSPNASFKYKFGKKEFARLIYRGTSTQPSITQMEPVRNNSNAMRETIGNLGLNPAFRHTLRLMYSRFNQDNFSSLMVGLNGNLTKDALVNNTIYDETGKVYQQTVNSESLPWDIGANLMYNIPFANKTLQFHTRTAVSYNQRVAYVARERQSSEIAGMIEKNLFMLGDLSKTGNLNLNENLNLHYTHDIVDAGITANVNYSRTMNNLNNHSLSDVVNWGISGDLEFHLPKNWNISTDISYTQRYGYQLKGDLSEILWNAAIDKTWGNGTLELRVYDLLHDKKNIVQVIGENYVQYHKYNTLPTYFMLTFTYKFNKMGDLKATGMAGHIQDMMESGSSTKGQAPMGPSRAK